MRIVAIAALGLSLAACTIPESTRGVVTELNSASVTIKGYAAYPEGTTELRPTQGMVAQAREVCENAEYLSWKKLPNDPYYVHYLFKC